MASVTLLSPANGATNVAVSGTALQWSTTAYGHSITVEGSSYYRSFDADSGGSAVLPLMPYNTTMTVYDRWSYPAFIDYQFVQVAASEVIGTFTTAGAPPSAFNLTSPANGVTGQPLSVTLSWQASANATSYEVYFGSTVAANNILNGTIQTATTRAVTGLTANTTYYWRIIARNAQGTATSSLWSFTTVSLPAKVTSPTPADLALDVDRGIGTISWTAGTGGGTPASYDVYFGTDESPDSGESQGNQTGTSFNVGVLKASTTYYWRVDAVNAAGTIPGDVWSFTTSALVTGTPRESRYKRRLIAAADDQIFYSDDSVPAKMEAVSGLEIDTTKGLSIVAAYQKVFIANDSIKKVVDFNNTCLTIGSALTAPPAHGDILTQATSGATMVVDYVSPDLKKIYGYVTTVAQFDTTNTVSGNPSDTLNPDFIPASVVLPYSTAIECDALTTAPAAADTLTQLGSVTVGALTTAPVSGDTLTQLTKLTLPLLTTAPEAGSIITQYGLSATAEAKLLLHLDGIDGAGSSIDSGASAHTVVFNGTAQLDTAQKKFGTSSLLLDGNSDYISIPDSTDFDFSNGSMTVDLWARFASVSGAQTLYFQGTAGINDTGIYWHNNTLYFYNRAGSAMVLYFSIPFVPVVDTWYHLAVVRNVNTWNIYINGTAGSKTLISGSYSATLASQTGDVEIGRQGANGNYFNGWIDEYRVLKGGAGWTANFAVPATAYSSGTETAGATLEVVSASTDDGTIIGVATGAFNTTDYIKDGDSNMAPAQPTPSAVAGGATLAVEYVNAAKTKIWGTVTGTLVANIPVSSDNTGATMAPAQPTATNVFAGGGTFTVVSVNAEKTLITGNTASGEIVPNEAIKSDDAGATMDPAYFVPSGFTKTLTPHHYNWTAYPALDGSADAEFGTLPAKATVAFLYRGRIGLSGNPDYPHQWYLSRQANPFDWLYMEDDAQSAVAGNNADAGQIGDAVVGVIPYSDDYVIFGCSGSLWLMRGDPAAGGTVDAINYEVGLLDKDAWCWDDNNNLYLVGTNGIYKKSAGSWVLENLTLNVIPNLIEDWQFLAEIFRVTMSFDQMRHGLIIAKTNKQTGENTNYWFDLRTQGFFPEDYPDSCGIMSKQFFNGDDLTLRQLIVGCADGYLRRFDDSKKDDDGTAIESEVLMGPFRISKDSNTDGLTNAQTFIMAGGGVGGSQPDSDAVNYEIFTAETAEEIIENADAATSTARASGTLASPGRNSKKRHRLRGIFAGIKLASSALAKTWAIDRVVIEFKSRGRTK